MKNLVYLVGPPGVGKSTVMAELTKGCGRVSRVSGQLRYDTLYRDQVPPQTADIVGVELGTRRESFSGTDALGMAVNPHAVDWITNQADGLVLGEGARLANQRFLRAALGAGFAVHLVHLSASPNALASRRAARGSNQSPSWIRGAETRARNIMEAMEPDVLRYFMSASYHTPKQLASMIREAVPALDVLP